MKFWVSYNFFFNKIEFISNLIILDLYTYKIKFFIFMDYSDEGDDFDELEEKEKEYLNDMVDGVGENIDISDMLPTNTISIDSIKKAKNSENLKKGLKKSLNFSMEPKLRINKKTKKIIKDVYKIKKTTDVNTANNIKKPKINSLDISNIEILENSEGPFFDIFSVALPLNIRIKNKLKKIIFLIKEKNKTFFKITIIVGSLGLFLYLYQLALLSYVKSGYNELIHISKNKSDIKGIKQNIIKSKNDLIVAELLFLPIDFLANNSLIKNKQIKNASFIIHGGKALAKSIDKFYYIYEKNKKIINDKGIENIYYTELIKKILPELEYAVKNMKIALFNYDQIKELGDKGQYLKFIESRKKLKKIYTFANDLIKNKDIIIDLLGDKKNKRYLVAFQNSDEIRPTGGFIGSMGILEVFKGKINKLNKKDIYAYEWDMKPFREIAPEGINKLTPTFGLRDANYYPDFQKSSKKINEFMTKIDNNLDGIFYINQNILLDYLKLVGTINLPIEEGEKKLNIPIDYNNFSLIMSTLVESKISKNGKKGTPKKILFDFMHIFYKKLKEKGDYLSYLKILLKNIKHRELVFNHFDDKYADFTKTMQIGGDISYDSIDFVYPVFTSISGNKSDRYIHRYFTKNVTKLGDCSYKTTLKIKTTHNFSINDSLKVKNLLYNLSINNKEKVNNLIYIQGKGDNRQYVRLYFPKDIVINNKEGFDIKIVGDKKVLTYYTSTKPLSSSDKIINYTIPNIDCKDYKFMLYKQPGIVSYDINFSQGANNLNITDLKKDFIYNGK